MGPSVVIRSILDRHARPICRSTKSEKKSVVYCYSRGEGEKKPSRLVHFWYQAVKHWLTLPRLQSSPMRCEGWKRDPPFCFLPSFSLSGISYVCGAGYIILCLSLLFSDLRCLMATFRRLSSSRPLSTERTYGLGLGMILPVARGQRRDLDSHSSITRKQYRFRSCTSVFFLNYESLQGTLPIINKLSYTEKPL